MVKQQSSVTPRFSVVRHGNRCTTYSHRVWEGGRERPRLSTRGCNHCFGLVVIELHLFTVIQVFMCVGMLGMAGVGDTIDMAGISDSQV